MKTLLVLRHAKSSWSDGDLDDHDRPLNGRGLRAAPRMGVLLAEQGLAPDIILPSTAVRARTTAELVSEAAGLSCEIAPTRELYLAAPRVYLSRLAELPEHIRLPMVVGHNPGLEALVERLTGEDLRMPTAALAVVELEGDTWPAAAERASGRLVRHWYPRELD